MNNKLTVVLVLRNGGDFSFKDVHLLSFHIRKQWKGKLRIICLNDRVSKIQKLADGLELHPMPNHWKGWWSKMNIFAPEMEQYRPFLYLDLDTAIVGSLNVLFPPTNIEQFITLENVYYPGRIGSGIMWIPALNEKISRIWNIWIQDPLKYMEIAGGDQRFIELNVKVDEFFGHEFITSFKPAPRQHWLINPRTDLSIIYFHGYPRIAEAATRTYWIQNYLNYADSFVTTDQSKKIKRAFVINLDSRKDRLKEFMSQKFPFPVERFPAIKGNPGIVGCNKSHVALLGVEMQLPFVIFEDDCKMIQDWSVVETAMKELPEHWDLLFIGANLNKPIERVSDHLFRLKDAWTTHAIIYGSQGVVDYIKAHCPTDRTPIDVFYSKSVLPNFNCYIVDPIAAIQRGSYSDVNKGIRDYEDLMVANFKRFTMKLDVNKWFADNGDTTHRLNYSLNSKSVVFDVGAYKGEFADKIYDKFKANIYCFEPVPEFKDALEVKYEKNKKIRVLPFALTNNNDQAVLRVHKNESGFQYPTGDEITVNCHTMDVITTMLQVDYIDLIKINIEGAEYPLLLDMIKKGTVNICENIQVQFHSFVPNHVKLYEEIRKELSKTHWLTFQYPFVWESWKLKKNSHSQVGQDLFALSFFPDDYKGTFLDIGCNLPDSINNTLLLEEKGWTGVSIDIVDFSKSWESRKSKFVCANALTQDYSQLGLPEVVDYLSLDIEGDGLRYKALKKVIESGLEFKVLTIEHDSYRGYEKSERDPQRKLLSYLGFKLVIADMCSNGHPFEDWWINPKYIK